MALFHSLLQLQVQNQIDFSEFSVHERLICPHKKQNCKFGDLENVSSGIPVATRYRSDLDIIRPEYTHPSGYFGVRAGACIRQNTVL